METVLTFLFIVQILAAIIMIGLILLQQGKGADMGAGMGAGSAGSIFGASGSANFLSRSTAILATIFFVSTLVLAYYGKPKSSQSDQRSVLENATGATQNGPATPEVLPNNNQNTANNPTSQIPDALEKQLPAPIKPAAPIAPIAPAAPR